MTVPEVMHFLGEAGNFGQIGVFFALLWIAQQMRQLRMELDKLTEQVVSHAHLISNLERTLERLQGWLDGKEGMHGR